MTLLLQHLNKNNSNITNTRTMNSSCITKQYLPHFHTPLNFQMVALVEGCPEMYLLLTFPCHIPSI